MSKASGRGSSSEGVNSMWTSVTSKEEPQERVQPDAPSSSMAAPVPFSSSNTASSMVPVAFVETDLVVRKKPNQDENEEGERVARAAAFPETIISGDTTSGASHYTDAVKFNGEKRRRKALRMTSIKSEEVDNSNTNNDHSHESNRRRSKRKQQPHSSSSSSLIQRCDDSTSPNYDSLQTNNNNNRKKRQRKNNQQGGEPAVASSTNRRCTSPRRNKKHHHQNDTIISSTGNNDNVDGMNCCKLCNDPGWENKIYYKCGTVLKKYFPKTNNNPNPGWYKGTIQMHYISYSDSDSDYEYPEEADSGSEEERSERQQIVFNEIHYDDGDTENITQDDLKFQVVGGRKIKILHSTKMATTSYLERHNPGNVGPPGTASNNKLDNAVPTTTASDNKYDKKWLEKYYRLKKFKGENGHCRVPNRYCPDRSLGKWVSKQRQQYKKGKMAADRMKKLEEIGFTWDAETTDQMWQENYDKLKKFKAGNGHCRITWRYCPDPALGSWVSWQRQHYKKGALAPDRLEKLEEIGFEWDARDARAGNIDQVWQEKYDRLKIFNAKNGHCRVPKNYGPDPSLGSWVRNQRFSYKKGNMTKDRLVKLNEIGFNRTRAAAVTWDEMLNRLKRFKAKNGNCRVPQDFGRDPSLGHWVHNQRTAYKKGKMASDRIEKLEEIDFEWGLRNC